MNKCIKIVISAIFAIYISAGDARALDFISAIQGVVADAGAVVKDVSTNIQGIKTKINKVKTAIKDKYTAAKKAILNSVNSNFFVGTSSKPKPLSSMKTMGKRSKLLSKEDRKDTEKVAEVIHQLFLAYPSTDPDIKSAYRKKSREFVTDSIVELYVSVRALDTQIEEMEDKVEAFADTQSQMAASASGASGEEGESKGDGEIVAALVSSYDAYGTIDELLKLAETLSVMRTQYYAAKFLDEMVEPAEFVEGGGKGKESKKSSALDEKLFKMPTYAQSEPYSKTFAMGYAAELKPQNKAMAANVVATQAKAADMKTTAAAPAAEIKNSANAKQALPQQKLSADKPAFRKVTQSVEASPMTSASSALQRSNAAAAVSAQTPALSSKAAIPPATKTLLKNETKSALSSSLSTSAKSSLTASNKMVTKDEIEQEDKEFFGDYKFDVKANSTLTYETAEKPDIESAFTGSEEEFRKLKELEAVAETMRKSMTAHNLKQSLPSFREAFVSYQRAVKRHDLAVEKVKTSDKCAVNYLDRYYPSGAKVWYGGAAPSNVTDYASRKGVSGWAYKAFQTAKALQSDDISPDDLEKSDFDAEDDTGEDVDATVQNSKAKLKQKHSRDEDSDGSSSVAGAGSPSRQEQIKKNEHLKDKFNFLIGAAVAKKLAQDQYTTQSWGKPKRKFPIWNDQKKFYDQYLEKKYQNMKLYLNDVWPFFDMDENDDGNTVTALTGTGIDMMSELVSRTRYDEDDDKNDKEKEKVRSAFSEFKTKLNGRKYDYTTNFFANKKLAELVSAKNQLIQGAKNTGETARRSLENKNKEITVQLEKLYTQKNELQTTIDNLKDTKKEAESTITDMDNNLEIVAKRQEVSKDKKSGQAIYAKETKAQSQSTLEKTNAQLTVANMQMSVLQQQITTLENEIAANKKKLNDDPDTCKKSLDKCSLEKQKECNNVESYACTDAKILYIEEYYSGADGEIQKQKNNTLDSRNKNGGLTKMYKKIYTNTVDRNTYILKFVGIVDDIVGTPSAGSCTAKADFSSHKWNGVLDYAKDRIICAEEKIKALRKKDDNYIYTPAGHKELMKIHKELIDELKNPQTSILTSLITKGYRTDRMISLAKSILQKYVMDKVCENNVCLNADTDFFVGAYPVARDFRAPRVAAQEYLPPMREIIYFDVDDYINMPKSYGYDDKNTYTGKKVTKEAILKSVSNMPEIWQRMLDLHSYVEESYNLFSTEDGTEGLGSPRDDKKNIEFFRSGIYPCKMGDYYVDIKIPATTALTKNGYILSRRAPKQSFDKIPNCQEIYLSQTKPSPMKPGGGVQDTVSDKVYAKAQGNVDFNDEIFADRGYAYSSSKERGSEMGLLFSASKQLGKSFIMITKGAKDTFYKIDKDEDGGDATESKKTSNSMAIKYRAQLNRNQFGDFLTLAENEQTTLQAQEELKEEVDALRESLIESLKKAGFSPKPDLDLAIDADYNQVAQAMESIKNKNLKTAYSSLSGMQEENNEYLKEKFKKLKGMYAALVKDNAEVVVVGEDTDGNSADFAQKVISEQVNRKASEEYKKQEEEAFANEMKGGVQPYCANYAVD